MLKPPRFRIRAESTPALLACTVSIETARPDGSQQVFTLADRAHLLVAGIVINEPGKPEIAGAKSQASPCSARRPMVGKPPGYADQDKAPEPHHNRRNNSRHTSPSFDFVVRDEGVRGQITPARFVSRAFPSLRFVLC